MLYRRDTDPLPRDGIYLTILVLLIANVFIGVALMLLGGEVWDNAAVSRAGFWLAGVSGLLYFFFRRLGARETRRKRMENEGERAER